MSSLEIVPVKPASLSIFEASSNDLPFTSGIGSWFEPTPTLRFTTLPALACTPAFGSVSTTLPLLASSDSTVSTFVSKPCSFKVASAEAWRAPTTFGTTTCFVPGLSTM